MSRKDSASSGAPRPTVDEILLLLDRNSPGTALDLTLQQMFQECIEVLRPEGIANLDEIEQNFLTDAPNSSAYRDAAMELMKAGPTTATGLVATVAISQLASVADLVDHVRRGETAAADWPAVAVMAYMLGRSSEAVRSSEAGTLEKAAKFSAGLAKSREGQAAAVASRTEKWRSDAMAILRSMCAADGTVSTESIAKRIDDNVSDAPSARQIATWVASVRRHDPSLTRKSRGNLTG